MSIRLSKSKLIAFRQCPKRLWLEVHRPDLKVYDDSAQSRFDAGDDVGEMARKQYPDGILVGPDDNLAEALRNTQALLASNIQKPLFEATYQADGLLIRADLLLPASNGWHLVEVKSATSVKEYHLEDVAIQHWVINRAGLHLGQTSVQVIDSSWTYPGGLDYSGLMKREPVSDAIAPMQELVTDWLDSARTIAAGTEPDINMGDQCSAPFSCSFQTYCQSKCAPVEFPISWLPNLHRVRRQRYEAAGVVDLREISGDDLTDRQRRVWKATIDRQTYFEPLSEHERNELAGVRYYVDFETMRFTIPIWAGTRPYQQVPFQWSCHVEQLDGALSHTMFLDLSGNDPSRAFAESLIAALGSEGPIIVYNQGFEKGIMGALAARYPDLAPSLLALLERVVDLMPLAIAHYYHPSMQGSWSIKTVLPAIAPELDYANLEDVSDGLGAQEAFREAIHSDTPPHRRAGLEAALREYCARDTLAMVRVLHFLIGETA